MSVTTWRQGCFLVMAALSIFASVKGAGGAAGLLLGVPMAGAFGALALFEGRQAKKQQQGDRASDGQGVGVNARTVMLAVAFVGLVALMAWRTFIAGG